jgi:serine/threonine protein kinase
MPLASVAGLVKALREHRLLPAVHLDEVAGNLQGRFTQPQNLARELLQRGWLTQFQIKHLFQERAQDLVVGPYVLVERLGKGGMGQVFKARHQLMNRLVALKIIRAECLANAEAALRFQREIELVAQLSHPNIVTAYDAAQADGRHFLVMEYVEGTDLHHLVEREGPLAAARAAGYIGQAALGLQHAHERGLVHRDIKPSNLLIAVREERVKILDLGLARTAAQSGSLTSHSQLTRLGTLVGTPEYMAPEQILDPRRADIRSDLYSLGCTLHFALTARSPFAGGTLTETLIRQQRDDPPDLEALRPDVPAALAMVLRQMLAKRPEDRYQTPAEVTAALGPLGPQPGKQRLGARVTAPARTWPGDLSRGGKTWKALVLVGALALLLLAGLMVWWIELP